MGIAPRLQGGLAGLLLVLFNAATPAPARAQEASPERPAGNLEREETPQDELHADDRGLAPEAADRRARELFEKGRDAFEEGEYRDAWDYFHRSYALSRRPRLLYNIGQSADRLRRDREALEAFRLYLKRLPDAENRKQVENRIRALEQQIRDDEEVPSPPAFFQNGAVPAASPTTAASDGAVSDGSSDAPSPARTGWHVRGAVGFGALRDGVTGSPIDATISGPTASVQVAGGYALGSGLVLGLGLSLDAVLSPSLAGERTSTDLDDMTLALLYGFVDYYLEPQQNGWHVLGGLGVGSLSISDSAAVVGSRSAGGAGLLFGAGYDWPFDERWALGVVGRVVLARMTDSPQEHAVLTPTVAFTAVWH
ncbi:MAG: tetratricopeptide repeat protein [Myxococcales bacterium]|jgi:hypothetical protein